MKSRTKMTALAALALIAGACSEAGSGAGGGVATDPGAGGGADTGASGGDAGSATPDTGSPAGPDGAGAPDGAGPPEVAAPEPLAIFTVTPDRGRSSGLEQVEINGTGFRSGVQVYFGESLAQDVFVLDDHRMAVLTPPRIPGLVDVRVVDPERELTATLEAAYLFFNPVSIVEIAPASGHVLGGDAITLIGTGFIPGSQVLIGGKAAISVEVLDDATLLAVTPDAAAAGPVDVHVSNSLGVGALADGFLYYDSPRVSGVKPAVGPVAGGTLVEVRGAGFVAPLAVSFGGLALADVAVLAPDRLAGRVPAAAAAGPVDVLVSTPFGTGVAIDGFTYLDDLAAGAVVQLLAVTPPAGPAAGGELVTLVAKGLTDSSDTVVRFGAAEATVKTVDAPGHTVVVTAPAGAVGPVDVTLTNANGADTLAGAYTYDAFVKVYEVLPNFGPTAGGTQVTVTGLGFAPGAQVRIGALPASAVTVVDGQTLTATTPPGSPGLANITVIQGPLSDTLVGGFSYQAPMALWVVTPPQGSQAGGTYIQLLGSGLPADATVRVGDSPATHVDVVSSTLITAKTPPGLVMTVDVTVDSASRGSATLPLAFTYYDPESQYGGTWGNEVDGDVNVTVLSGADGSPIADAFVMLWTDPQTPYQGYTNQQGQITFSGPELAGEQMVSASKPGFASTSVIEYDAENVTLYMTPTTMSSGAPPPGVPAPTFRGQVVNLTKYVPVPWGQCSQKTTAPGTLCDPCVTDADCGALRCSELPGQGRYCTSHCVNNTDCADGFMCYPLNGVPEPQCVPSAGVITAFCDHTIGSIFSQDRTWPPVAALGQVAEMARPGLQVNEDFSFEMTLPIGELAVYCFGGVLNADAMTFEPFAMGIKRNVLALPEGVYEHDIVLSHALNSELEVRLDNPPRGLYGPDFDYMFVHLDLGSDGVLTLLDDAFAFGDEPLVKTHVPKTLSGNLYDATYTLLAGAFSFTEDNLPYSLTLHTGIKSPSDDRMYRVAANGWQPWATGVTQNINGLWGQSAEDVIGVGSDGLIVRTIGEVWAKQPSGVSQHLKAVHGLATGEAMAVGLDGAVTAYDGTVWTPQISGTISDLEGVWMASPSDAFAVGWYTVLRFDGSAWTPMAGNTSKNLRGVWGFAPDDVWAVGSYGQVIHYDGAAWTTVPTFTTQNLRAVWGPAPDDVTIVGEGGTVLHWDGVALTPVPVDSLRTLEAIWGSAADDMVAVGARGTILRYDGAQWLDESPPGYDATFLAVGGAGGRVIATGTHELLLGPLLAVPENISPLDLGTMADDYEITWTLQPDHPDPHFSYVQVAIPGLFGPTPEWTTVNDWNVNDILLPDFPNIEGTPGISPGPKILTIIRVYKEGFDIDNYSNLDLNTLNWNSWAQDTTTFTKL